MKSTYKILGLLEILAMKKIKIQLSERILDIIAKPLNKDFTKCMFQRFRTSFERRA